jgi:ankyrin repeat protein
VPLEPDQSPAWLARNENFNSWIRGYTRRLTICGSAGSGKTHLVRHIVSHLKPNNGFQSQREDREVLVHFVDWKDKDRLAPTFVLRSFLLQLLNSNPGLFKQVYTRMHDPPFIYEDLEQLLVDLLSNSRIHELTLVVHGIDNMDEPSRDQIGGTLVRLLSAKKGMPNAKVLLSCRASGVFSEQVEELFSHLGFGKSEMSELSLDAVALAGQSSEEFEKHVQRCITAMPNSHKLSSELRNLIEECLITKTMSAGRVQRAEESNVAPKSLLNNFLWISLVAELIGSEQSPSKIRELLGKATQELNDLESVYTQLIERTPSHVEITRILRFIQRARRPLTIEELAFAIAIRAHHASAQKVVDQQFFSLDAILEQYASALVLFQNDTVSLRHPSMSDHLGKHLSLSTTDTHAELAKACLWSLFLGAGNHAGSAPITIEGVPPDKALFDVFTHPLMRYASECWFEHVRLALPNDSDQFVLHLTIKFVISDVGRRWKDWYCKVGGKEDYPSEASPVHVFAALNLLSNPETFRFFYTDLGKQDDSGKSVIYYAAANNAHATIDMILDQHGKDQLFDTTGQDMLYLAVTKTNLRLLMKILEQPNLEIPQSLLIAAIDGRHWSAFELLKQHLEHSRPRKEAHQFWTSFSDENGGALHHAVLSRNLALVEAFLKEGADPNDNTGGKTPLHLAAQIGDELITEAILKAGGDVNIEDEQGNTPLHYATEVGSPNVFNLLTDCGAQIGMLNYKRQTALHVAARYGHEDIVLLLLASGAEVNGKDKESTTPLHLACAGSWQPVVRRLLDQGGNPYIMTEKKRTPLHLAAANGSREIAGMLLDVGADVDARDSAQQTPLHAAVQRGSVDLVLMLIERGADPSATDEYGKSPLHYAAASDSASAKIVQLLMERGANVDIRDNEQHKTALDFAQAEGNNIIAALLKASRRMPRGPWGVHRSGSWIEGESLKSEPSMESLTGNEIVILEGNKYRQIP